ncbi:hypothetical protein D9Q98_001937 [Chlorella vulgaris]|uniref:Conserved oligomeric Golgi complex subunit 8 n=1 Tax=Chlorella vulgaris TaxID=3077 RepID=A0A9D4TVC5_CHLVU|nr:hypothetical protein D9Q98_001937 [Chlorella vulgaris]
MDAAIGTDKRPAEELQQEESAYFSELLSYSLERLSKEPELLRADQEQLRRQLQDTAVGHYRSFIDTTQCLADLRQQLTAATGHLDDLSRDLPKLQAACDRFRHDAAAITTKRADNRQLYGTHPTVLEVLEVPQLMDTCCRSGNFDEALDLRAFVNKVAVMHGDLPLVQRLVAEVGGVSADMLEQLLQRLQGAVQLPECLRIIGYLRRLAAFPEAELRRAFLQRRETWIAGLVAELDDSHAYELLKRLTDVYRLHLFDVVMQYRAIFSDEAPATSGGGSEQGASGSRDGGILYVWAQRRIAAYLEAIRQHLPAIGEGGSLASVLDHTMYCGASLGRVGLDFRPLLAPLFEQAVVALYTKSVKAATASFHSLLDAHKWSSPSALSARSRQASDAAAASASAAAAADAATSGAEAAAPSPRGSTAPPQALVDHMPLAVYTNGLLAAFNELRHCAPLSVQQPTTARLQESLLAVSAELAHYGLTHSLTSPEQLAFDSACHAHTTALCPYVSSCLERIYPGAAAQLDLQAVARPIADMAAQRQADSN